MADVIPFAPSPRKSGGTFSSTADPIAFLDAVETTLAEGDNLRPFEEGLEDFLAAIQPSQWFTVFARACRILARVDWGTLREPWEPRCAPSLQPDSALEKLSNSILESGEALALLHKKATQRGVQNFPPAYLYIDAFDQTFGNDSPLDYIGGFKYQVQQLKKSNWNQAVEP